MTVFDMIIVLIYAAIYLYVTIPAAVSLVFNISFGASLISTELLLGVIFGLMIFGTPIICVLSLLEKYLFDVEGNARPRWHLKKLFGSHKI